MIKKIGNIVMISLSDIDSNIYLLDDHVIDAGTGFNFTRLMDMLRIAKKSLEDFKWVVNTHGHFDHIGGDGYFLGAKTAIHEKDAFIIEKGDMNASMADFFDGKIKPRQVDRKLKEGELIKAAGLELQVLHTPGHSLGSICLYDKTQKLLFSGDTIFADGLGRVDIVNGNGDELMKSVKKLSALDVDKILPGHGEPVLSGGKKVIKELLSGA